MTGAGLGEEATASGAPAETIEGPVQRFGGRGVQGELWGEGPWATGHSGLSQG